MIPIRLNGRSFSQVHRIPCSTYKQVCIVCLVDGFLVEGGAYSHTNRFDAGNVRASLLSVWFGSAILREQLLIAMHLFFDLRILPVVYDL